MVAICSWSQDWALMRRYLTLMFRYPLSTATRAVLLPGLVIGLSWYLLASMSNDPRQATIFINLIGLIVSMTTIFNAYSFTTTLVTDKATGMKSLMLSMGLSRFHYYRANTLIFLMLILPVTLMISVIIKDYLMPRVGYLTVVAIFLLFSLQLDAFVTMLVSFIKSTNYTFIILLTLFLENYLHELGKLIVKPVASSWNGPFLFLLSFSPYEPIRLFSDRIILDSPDVDMLQLKDDVIRILDQPLYLIYLSQLFWTLFCKLFAVWFEEVCPWQTVSGVRHLCFCFGSAAKSQQVSVDDFTDNPAISNKYFETIEKSPSDIGIRVNHVTKSYSKVPAVNDVSFSIYKGETTLLLGHNGAGKSTLMNMILGLIEPDNGAVKVLARTQLQTSMGVCPQTSVLDENLNVKQHLELFNDLKSNISGYERASHIRQTINDVSLVGQENKLPSELSGGMKRKLSLAIAFIGKSQVLILDEPSSGLDPDSRVFVWNAIRRYRSDRTVLLSTQHMEEADYLGDRIAIMSSGRIVCCGSSVFLNGLFGTGYKLRLECKLSKKKDIMEHIRRSFFDKAQFTEESSDLPRDAKSDPIVDLVIELNKTNDDNKQTDYELDLIRLLENFENNSDKLGVRSYGLKSSSIEDVMLNTSKYFAHEAKAATQLVMTSVSGHIAAVTDKKVLREPSYWTQLSALVMKHIHVNWANLFSVLILKLAMPAWGCYQVVGKAMYDSVGIGQLFQSPPLGLLFAHLIYFPVRERSTKFKTVQLDTKAAVWIYWLSQVIIDLTGLVVNLAFINLFCHFRLRESLILVPASEIQTLLSAGTILFYLACMVFCYCLSNVLHDPKTAVGYLFIILFLSTATWFLLYLFRLSFFKMSALQWLQDDLAYLGVLLLPTDAYACFVMGLRAKCYIRLEGENCQMLDERSPIIVGLVGLAIQILVYSILLVLIESHMVNIEWYFSWRNLFSCCFQPQLMTDAREIDRDVAEETTKALTAIDNPDNGCALVAAGLNKSYIMHKKVIQDLAFTVNKGECFGLLGVNGAGKSTTFSMLSGESYPDTGRLLANDRYYDQNLHRYRELFGYDPQATPELSLTPYQALYLMAKLRGVNEHSIPMMIGSILELLEMSQHTNKPDSKLSGGTKRKLALGMALIGNPAILALDEPTAGVDPLARRGIWQLLRSLRTRNDASIIISSHAMEECEAICDRISIMSRGKIRCIGTFLHLRSKFAKGFTLRIQFSKAEGSAKSSNAGVGSSQQRRPIVSTEGSPILAGQRSQSKSGMTAVTPVKTTDSRRSSNASLQALNPLIEELQQLLSSAIGPSVFKLADRNVNSVTFNITDNRVRRSILFRLMRDFRQKHPNASYIFNDSSLEEIFISLAREQQEFEQTQSRQHNQQQAQLIAVGVAQ